MKMSNNQSVYKRSLEGFKSGLKVQSLPPRLDLFNNNIYVKVFKIFGSINLFLMVSKLNQNLFESLIIVNITIAVVFTLYMFILIIIRWIYFIILIKRGKYSVRNSPIDHLASFFKIFAGISKATYSTATGTGLVFGLAAGMDSILEANGESKVFIPKLASMVKDNT